MGTIDIDKLLDRFLNFLFGSLVSRLVTAGLGFLSFGLLDVVVFTIETYLLDRAVESPGSSFGWQESLGLFLLFLGLLISFSKYLISRKSNNSKKRLDLLENYQSIGDARLQQGFAKYYGIINPDVIALRRVLSHPTNQAGALSLFQFCHMNIECNDNWFSLKGRFFKLRYYFGFVLWLAFPLLAITSFLLAAMEYKSPGITSSGDHAAEIYLLMCLLVSAGAALMMKELQKIGAAIHLCEKFAPVRQSGSLDDGNSENEGVYIKRNRDVEVLRRVLSTIHIPTIDQHVVDSPYMISDSVLYFWEGFNSAVTGSLFNLYDKELEGLLREFHSAWEKSVAFGQYYHANHSGSAYIFSNPGDAPFSELQEAAWEAILNANSTMKECLRKIIEMVRDKYIEMDVEETNFTAWNDYVQQVRETAEIFSD